MATKRNPALVDIQGRDHRARPPKIWPSDDWPANCELQDSALENFCQIVGAGFSKRAASIRAFPFESPNRASKRACAILKHSAIIRRIEFLKGGIRPRAEAPLSEESNSELTPQELRQLVAREARTGNTQAINAALKMLDVQQRQQDTAPSPERIVEYLTNGCKNGADSLSQLKQVIRLLIETYGPQLFMDAIPPVSHNKDYVTESIDQPIL